jgi:GNAT superfamily N-acetyltransferase
MAKGREGDSSGTTVRAFRDSDWESDVATLHGLYNEAFRYLWGFVPMSAQEFAHQAQTFRPFYKPSLIAIAEDDEGPVGFAVVLPDINEALSQLNGRLFPTGWIALLRGIRRIQSARFLLLGVLPGHRGRGIAPLMSERLSVEARRLGVMKADIALVQSSNRQMLHVVESMGCVPSRRFRLFSKDL